MSGLSGGFHPFQYHYVGRFSISGTWVAPSQLRRQVKGLLSQGLKFVVSPPFNPPPRGEETGAPVGRLWSTQGAGPPFACLTFDDGLQGVFRYGLPVLEELGVKGALFVPTAYIGGKNLWDATFGAPKHHITKEQLCELHSLGWEIGSHTAHHYDLTRLGGEMLKSELADSKALLEELTGSEVRGIAYPFGRADRRVAEAAGEQGYSYGYLGRRMNMSPASPLAIPRYGVYITDLSLWPKLHPFWGGVDGGVSLAFNYFASWSARAAHSSRILRFLSGMKREAIPPR